MQIIYRIRLLGPIQVEKEGRQLQEFESRKALALLGYLSQQDQPVLRNQLAGLFWGDKPEARGRRNLSRELSQLSAQLPDCFQADYYTIQFNLPAGYWLDTIIFTQLVRESLIRPEPRAESGRDIEASKSLAALFPQYGEAEFQPEKLAEAVGLYRGDFMAGYYLDDCPEFESWLTREQENWRRQVTEVLDRLVAHYALRGQDNQAELYSRRWLELEPWQERAHRYLMILLARNDQRAEALTQYEICRRVLKEELDVEPTAETSALYEQIRTGEFSREAREQKHRGVEERPVQQESSPEVAASSSSAAAKSTSPQAPWQHPPLPDRYINRPELEQALLTRLETQPTVVLTGLGGAGKSTLAAWAAHQVAGSLVEGIIWIDDCRSATGNFDLFDAQRRIAQSCQVELQGSSLAERAGELRSLLRDKAYLLVLDDVWGSEALEYIRVHSRQSRLLVTSRDATVAYGLGSEAPLTISGFTPREGRALLRPADEIEELLPAELDELLARVGYLPLALAILKALLQDGFTVAELLAHFRQEQPDLTILDMDQSNTRSKSMTACFDLSYNQLSSAEMQQYFSQLGQFNGLFPVEAVAALWKLEPLKVRRILAQFVRMALVSQEGPRYRLHPLVRDYARQKLLTAWPELAVQTQQRYAAFYIRHGLYHPQLLEGEMAPAPTLDEVWSDVIAGVKWAAGHAPELAAWATLLAHTERPALLEAVGPDLMAAIQRYSTQLTDRSKQALWNELLGDLHLLNQENEAALTCFKRASDLWLSMENGLASSRAKLRQAGVQLLQEKLAQATETARQAQERLAQSLPLGPDEAAAAEQLFYWFDMIYVALVRWEKLPQADVANLARLGEQSGNDLLKARGYHIYRLWCTVKEIERPPEVRALGRELAQRAIQLWRAAGETDKADSEAMWSEYLLTGRCEPEDANRFAWRISNDTPKMNQEQIMLIKEEGVRWWLQTAEAERVAWLSQMLPRYLKASNQPEPPLEPDSWEWQWVRDIIGMRVRLQEASRRLALESHLPTSNHFLNIPEWRVFSSQRMFPIVDKASEQLVKACLAALEAEATD